jgi:hypothetical protein
MPVIKDERTFLDSLVTCPECHKAFRCRKTISVKGVSADMGLIQAADPGWNTRELSDDEKLGLWDIWEQRKVWAALNEFRNLYAENSDKTCDDYSHSMVFGCPYCRASVQMLFRMELVGVKSVSPTNAEEEIAASVPAGSQPLMSEEERKLFEEWKSNGFLKNFFEAASVDNPAMGMVIDKPAHKQLRAVMSWFRTAVAIELRRSQLARFITEFNTTDIDCFASNAVAAVLAEGRIKCLLPMSVARSEFTKEKLRIGNGNGSINLTKTPGLDYWVKTRWGYTTGKGLFFQALQQQSIGAFGRATRSQRRTNSPRGAEDEELAEVAE